MQTLDQLAWTLLARLGWSSLQAAVLVALVALLIRLLPSLPAALRCTLWWLVGVQLMVGLLWHAPVRLPLLSPPAIEHIANSPALYRASAPAAANTPVTNDLHSAVRTPEAPPARWPLLLGMLWLAGLTLQLPGAIRHGRQSRTLLRESKPSADPNLQARCAATATAFGLRRLPRLYMSDAVVSPQVLGLRRPTILLPTRWELTPDEASLALAHELALLRRGDLWMGWIPALAQRLFFFHPLATWAMREYALSREAACDAQVLPQPGTEPQRYGQLLLRLGVAQPRCAGLAGAAPSFDQLKRRLTMLQRTSGGIPHVRGWLLVALVGFVGVLPYRVVASGHATSSAALASASFTTPPAPLAPSATLVPSASPVATRSAPSSPLDMTPPPLSQPAPPAASSFGSPRAGALTDRNKQNCDAANGISFCGAKLLVFTHAVQKGQGLVLFEQGKVVIAGTNNDILAAKALYRPDARLLWFRRGDKTFVVRSPAALRKADALMARLTEAQSPYASSAAVLTLFAEEGQLLARKDQIISQEAQLVDEQGQLATPQALAPNPAQNQRTLEHIRTRRAALRQEIIAMGGQANALQERIRQQQANLHVQHHAPWDDFNRLVTGLAKLTNETLADGSAQEVHL